MTARTLTKYKSNSFIPHDSYPDCFNDEDSTGNVLNCCWTGNVLNCWTGNVLNCCGTGNVLNCWTGNVLNCCTGNVRNCCGTGIGSFIKG